MLRVFSAAITDDDTAVAEAVLDSIRAGPDGETPAASHIIGVSLGVLDEWFTDPQLRAGLRSVRIPG